MRVWVRMAAASVAALFCMGQAAPDRIDYVLSPVFSGGTLTAVQYDLRFRGDADGETALRLPSSWGGRDELWRGIDAISVVAGGALRDGAGPNERFVTHQPNAALHIRYRVVQDFEGAPNAQQGNAYRPIVQPTYFHLIGEASMVTPAERDLSTPVRWSARNLPRGWALASDLETRGRVLGDVWSSVTVAGDFRVIRDRESQVRVAIRGNWSFTDASFSESVSEIIAGQRRFFGDRASPYLVTVIQLDAPEGWVSIGGTGLGDAFAFFATPNGEARTITRTLAHEGLHTWIPIRLGGVSREAEAGDYWLSEGLTDFYTGRILVREGVWTPAEFADDFNRTLREYAQSPERTAPNARILEAFWTSQAVQQLPYQRGRMLATSWDARLRAGGHSFDDVVHEMRRRAGMNESGTAAEVLPAVTRLYGLDISGDLTTYVAEGAAVLLPEDVFAPCGRVVTQELVPFHRGFDIEATVANNNVITGVDPALPAYAAGVRNGMTLIRRESGEIGNSGLEIAYILRDGDQERTFRYIPRGHGTYTQQQLEIAEGLAGEQLAQCVAVLGGRAA